MIRSMISFALIAIIAAAPGCSRKEEDEPAPPKPFAKGGGATTAKNKQPIPAGDGIVVGQVTLDGDFPDMPLIEGMAKHQDHKGCLDMAPEAQKISQKWIIDKESRGIANVVIYLKPPPGKYFQVKDEDKNRNDTVSTDQPHCAFVPHVNAAFPAYWDGENYQPSGQKFVVKNSAPMNHNTNWAGGKTPGGNVIIKPGDQQPIKLVPDPSNPVMLKCDIHPWMTGTVFSFDHPYYAVTDKQGKFQFKNVPTGVEVGIFGWNEAQLNFFQETKKFNSGENRQDFKIKAK